MSDYPAPVVNGRYYPFAKLTPDYSAGYGPSCPDCEEPYQWHGGPVMLRASDTDQALASVCRDCATDVYAVRPGAEWQTRGHSLHPTTLVIP